VYFATLRRDGKYELRSSANIATADRLSGLFQKTPYTHQKLWQGKYLPHKLTPT
jgi:hypothetical protein